MLNELFLLQNVYGQPFATCLLPLLLAAGHNSHENILDIFTLYNNPIIQHILCLKKS